jgi:hypothetical protein
MKKLIIRELQNTMGHLLLSELEYGKAVLMVDKLTHYIARIQNTVELDNKVALTILFELAKSCHDETKEWVENSAINEPIIELIKKVNGKPVVEQNVVEQNKE